MRESLRGKQILLIGGTGFIGKVWLANLLTELPEIGRDLPACAAQHDRRRRSSASSAWSRNRRCSRSWRTRYGDNFADFLRERVEVVEGDVQQAGSRAWRRKRAAKLARSLDVIVNSSGLTDFNPDLRDALATNVRATAYLLDFLRECDHAALLHLSTCYVVGRRDGRILEELPTELHAARRAGFRRRERVAIARSARSARPKRARNRRKSTAELRRQALEKKHAAKDLQGAALENQIRKNRVRWLRQTLTEAGTRRANELGWPNTYTFTKSLSESLIRNFLDAAPDAAIAVVRPSIVESSIEKPFLGWNEGHQHVGVAFLPARNIFPAASDERKQVPRPDSGGPGVARHDADRRGAGRRGGTSACINWRRPWRIRATCAGRSS